MRKVLAATAFAVAFAGLASADPIGPDCDSCNGAIYTLHYSGNPIESTLLTQTFLITLTVDTSGVTAANPNAVTLFAVAFKAAEEVNSGSLFTAPLPMSQWNTEINSGTNANGCSGAGGGFVCSEVNSGNGLSLGPIYTFAWTITVDTGTLDPGAAHVKAVYFNANGRNAGQTSEDITLQVSDDCVGCSDDPVPEPSTYAMIGIAAVALGLWKRKLC